MSSRRSFSQSTVTSWPVLASIVGPGYVPS